MSVVRMIADLHLGHKTISEKAGELRGGTNTAEHDEWIIKQWNSVAKKQDLTWVLGDVAFTKDSLALVKRLNGVKHLIFGNHDEYALKLYLQYFNKVHGFYSYKGFWLSHAQIKETSLRNKGNIHGHTHSKTLDQHPYYCVSVEALNGIPIEFTKIKQMYQERLK